MIKRVAAMVSLLMLLFLVGCGGGGGGDGASVTPNVTSLQFTGISGESIAAQNIDVTLTNASGTVYAAVETADSTVATATFAITGGTTATITVTPSAFRTPGTYQTTVTLRIYRNPNGTDLISSFSYPVTLMVVPGLSVNPTALSLSALEGGSTQANLAVTLPQGVVGTVGAALAPGQLAAPWLNLAVIGNSTVQVNTSAASLPAGVYQRDLEISLPRPTGMVVVRVPLTFTVGVGLVAPANQTLTLGLNSTLASLSGTVSVARADGAATAWTAASSQPWLVFASAAGTTPGTLTFGVDAVQAAAVPQFADSTATVTISTPGLSPASFTVTLQKRLPYVAFAGPYGLPAGAPVSIVVGGRGFNQISDPVAALQPSGMNILSANVLSDTQMALTVSMAAGGVPFTVGIANAAGISTPSAQLWFSTPFSYTPATVPHAGARNIYLHDPVRHAVFALSRTGDTLVRYRLVGNTWTVTSMPHSGPLNMALAPDGSRIWMTDQTSRLVEVDPDTMTVVNLYVANFGIIQNLGGVLPVSSDGRLWLPGSANYFDLLTRTFGTLNASLPFNIEFGAYHGSLDGSLVLISPSYQFSPRPPYWAYEPVNGLLSNPMGNTELGYEPRISLDGSRTLVEYTGRLYNRAFSLLGQLPVPPATDSYSLMTLTPDGSKILVLRKTYTTSSQVVLASQAIDVYSTSAFAPGTTDFAKTGSIAITTDASFCNSNSNDCYYGNQYLLPTQDSKTVFWIGNQNMQAFSVP